VIHTAHRAPRRRTAARWWLADIVDSLALRFGPTLASYASEAHDRNRRTYR